MIRHNKVQVINVREASMQDQKFKNSTNLVYLRVLFIFLTMAAFTNASAGKIVWPDLKKVAHVTGRAANKHDLNHHRAAFVLKLKGVPAGVPIKIKIPQYAIHTDQATGEKTPVVIIQAEHIDKFIAYGYLNVATGKIEVTYPEEIKLLGTKKPLIQKLRSLN